MPRCTDLSCARWRPERLTPRWAIGIRFNGQWFCSSGCVERAARAGLTVVEDILCRRLGGFEETWRY